MMETRPAEPRAHDAPATLVIVGDPVAQSLSPVFQNAALRHAGRAVTYSRCQVPAERLDGTISELRRARTGGNVTMPHKEAMFARAVHTTRAARRTGAVNTFWWDGEALVGHNTDVDGVAATLTALCADGVRGDVLLLGAGGSAAAVLEALAQTPATRDARVLVTSRTRTRAERLVAAVGRQATVVSPEAVRWSELGLVVNATPAGMRDEDAQPVAVEHLGAHTVVFDLVYRRGGTVWVREARARGLRAEDGLRMLVEQGAAAYTCWFGEAPSREVMWAALGVPAPAPDAPRT
jgi:shikimate dehydrogenase